jgi:pteridine reductase
VSGLPESPIALVTGGARRLGANLVRALAEEGFRVGFSYRRSAAAAEQLVDDLEAGDLNAAGFECDLREASECAALVETVEADLGPISLLVNNAGVIHEAGVDSAGVEDFDATMAVNLRAPWLLSLDLGRRMRSRGSGSIINIASVGGIRPYSKHLAYSVSKAGLIMLTRGLARDLAPEVRVNAIAPGMIDLGESEGMPARDRVPLQSWAGPEDIEDAVLYLADAGQVTGQVLAVDGGWHLSA